MSFSFEERVIKRTNELITRYCGNVKRFQNKHLYNAWYQDGLFKNELQVGKVGETYGEIYLIRTSKAATKKNRPKIRELNMLLKKKKNSIATIDELANFIGFIVTGIKPEPKVKESETETSKKVDTRIKDNTIINDNDFDGLKLNYQSSNTPILDTWEDNLETNNDNFSFTGEIKPSDQTKLERVSPLNLPSVENWEDL